MSFHSYRVVFYDPIPTGPRTPDFGSCSMSYILQTARGRYSGLSDPVYHLNRDERQLNLSYMVLLDMWNMFGKNSSVSSEASWLGGCNRASYS